MDDKHHEGSLGEEALFLEILPLAMVIAQRFQNIPGSTPDELRSEAQLAAWDAACAYKPGEGRSFTPFARRVINNRLTDLFRKEKNFRSVVAVTLDTPLSEDSFDTQGGLTPSNESRQGVDLVCIREANTVLTELINELPESHRDVLTAYMRGQAGSDIARAMGVTKQSISAIRSKALMALRQKLGERGVNQSTQLQARRNGSHREPNIAECLNRASNDPIEDITADEVLDALLPTL